MNNEFKKIKTDTETRYVLESMTAGGTGASNVASAPGTVRNVQKRSDNILAQEAGKKKKIPPSTPRNFVAKNAKTGGAGAHTDKRKEIPRNAKHKKPTFEDHEVQMASSELQTAAKEAVQILKMIQQYGEGQGLEAWQQSKITKAADYLHSVVQSISGRQHVAEAGKVCQQCGMKGCTCAPGKCKCTPKPGYPKKDVAEGAKVDRQAAHITKSMMKKGKSKKDAEGIAWAHIKHPKKAKESKDTYTESLINRLTNQLK